MALEWLGCTHASPFDFGACASHGSFAATPPRGAVARRGRHPRARSASPPRPADPCIADLREHAHRRRALAGWPAARTRDVEQHAWRQVPWACFRDRAHTNGRLWAVPLAASSEESTRSASPSRHLRQAREHRASSRRRPCRGASRESATGARPRFSARRVAPRTRRGSRRSRHPRATTCSSGSADRWRSTRRRAAGARTTAARRPSP